MHLEDLVAVLALGHVCVGGAQVPELACAGILYPLHTQPPALRSLRRHELHRLHPFQPSASLVTTTRGAAHLIVQSCLLRPEHLPPDALILLNIQHDHLQP